MMGMAAVAGFARVVRQMSRPLDLGQHQIEDQQVGRPGRQHREHVAARRQDLHGEASLFEVASDQLGDVAVVLDDEDARRHGSSILTGNTPMTSVEDTSYRRKLRKHTPPTHGIALVVVTVTWSSASVRGPREPRRRRRP